MSLSVKRSAYSDSVPVVARQIDRDGLVPRRAKEGHHAVPIPGHAARPGDENE